MTDQSTENVMKTFGGKLRIRVCGICERDGALLLVGHKGMTGADIFWSPPGGGMEFGQSAVENLKREFREETGLEIKIEKYLFSHEYLDPPLHAVELFFLVKPIGGLLRKGTDPELEVETQIISDVKYLNWKAINALNRAEKHQIFHHVHDIKKLLQLQGAFLDHSANRI